MPLFKQKIKTKYHPDLFYLKGDLTTEKNIIGKWKKLHLIPHNIPFSKIWEKDNKKIAYICVKSKNLLEDETTENSSLDFDNYTDGTFENSKPVQEKDIKFIEKFLSNNNYDLIMIPNLSFDKGINPQYEEIGDISPENVYIINLIDKYKIPFVGYTDDDEKFINDLTERGFNGYEILIYIFLNLYTYYSRDIRADKETFSKVVKVAMKDYENFIFPPKKKNFVSNLLSFFNSDDGEEEISYNKLFKELFSKDFNYGTTPYSLVSPDKDSLIFSKRISYYDWVYKNKFMVEELFNFLQDFNNIVILAEENYLYSQEKVIDNQFGEGKYFI